MAEEKKRISIWVDAQDRADMQVLKSVIGLSSNSAALRYALRRVRGEVSKTTPSNAVADGQHD